MKITEEQKQSLEKRKDLIRQTIEDAKQKCLPCPFCGDFPLVINIRNTNNATFIIGCDCFDRDYFSTPTIKTKSFRNINLAVEQWNTRKKID